MFEVIAYADGVDNLLYKLNAKIINPLIELSFIVALVVFLWGVLQFIRGANNEEARGKGKQHMLWGFVGFLIMFGVFGIINILTRTLGITGTTINKDQQTFKAPTIKELNLPK